jgi:Arc/MetJ-type ribon-helix-helix transcriptional regulator
MIRRMETTERLTVTVPIEVGADARRIVADGDAASMSALVTEALNMLLERRAARETYARFAASRDLETIRETDAGAYEWGRGLMGRLEQRERTISGESAA